LFDPSHGMIVLDPRKFIKRSELSCRQKPFVPVVVVSAIFALFARGVDFGTFLHARYSQIFDR